VRHFRFYLRDTASTLSTLFAAIACLSVHPSQASIVSKRLSVGSGKQCHMIALDMDVIRVSLIHFKFWALNHISAMTEATVVIFCTQVGYIKCNSCDNKSPLKWAWSGSSNPLQIFSVD